MVFSDKVSGIIRRWDDRQQCGFITSEAFEGEIAVSKDHINKQLYVFYSPYFEFMTNHIFINDSNHVKVFISNVYKITGPT